MSRGRLLLLAQRRGGPLGDPPEHFGYSERAAWREIGRAAPPVFGNLDATFLTVLAMSLTAWRQGRMRSEWLRELYRGLGHFFVPMPERRRPGYKRQRASPRLLSCFVVR